MLKVLSVLGGSLLLLFIGAWFVLVGSSSPSKNVTAVADQVQQATTTPTVDPAAAAAAALGASATAATPAVVSVPVVPVKQVPPISNNKKIMNVTLHTNKGDITIELYGTDAPNTVANFEKLAQAGFYNGTKFHRVVKGFMIQGGDPLTKDDSMMARWGTGGPGYAFPDEIHANNHNDAGTIAMANSGSNTNGSQFFINVAPNNFLDTKHTVFGHVTAGMNVVTAIENTPTVPVDRPADAIVLTSITSN